MNKLKSTLMGAMAAGMVLFPGVALAVNNPFNDASNMAKDVGNSSGLTQGGQTDLRIIIGRIINITLGFLGIVFLFLTLYAGFLWMTAQGDDKQVGKAKDMIRQAVIGLVVIVASYAISSFVLGSLANVVSGT